MKYLRRLSIIVLVALSLYAAYFYFFQPRWSSHVFAESDGGKDPELLGHFSSLEDCQAESAKSIQIGKSLSNGHKVNAFVCGRDCTFDGLTGSVYAEEIQCAEAHFSTQK